MTGEVIAAHIIDEKREQLRELRESLEATLVCAQISDV
jgi:hypothetical protein